MRPGEARAQSGSDTRKVQTFCGEEISDLKHGHGGDPGPEAVRGGAADPQTGGRDRENEAEKVREAFKKINHNYRELVPTRGRGVK